MLGTITWTIQGRTRLYISICQNFRVQNRHNTDKAAQTRHISLARPCLCVCPIRVLTQCSVDNMSIYILDPLCFLEEEIRFPQGHTSTAGKQLKGKKRINFFFLVWVTERKNLSFTDFILKLNLFGLNCSWHVAGLIFHDGILENWNMTILKQLWRGDAPLYEVFVRHFFSVYGREGSSIRLNLRSTRFVPWNYLWLLSHFSKCVYIYICFLRKPRSSSPSD